MGISQLIEIEIPGANLFIDSQMVLTRFLKIYGEKRAVLSTHGSGKLNASVLKYKSRSLYLISYKNQLICINT